jgi:hypothetical protein
MYLIVSYPHLCTMVRVVISNDFVCEVHLAIVKVVGENNINLEKMEEFWFCGIKSLMKHFV